MFRNFKQLISASVCNSTATANCLQYVADYPTVSGSKPELCKNRPKNMTSNQYEYNLYEVRRALAMTSSQGHSLITLIDQPRPPCARVPPHPTCRRPSAPDPQLLNDGLTINATQRN